MEVRRTNGGIRILDSKALLDDAVVADKPDDSLLYQLVTADDDSAMPPAGQPRLAANDIAAIRQWIAAGARLFPRISTRPEASRPMRPRHSDRC